MAKKKKKLTDEQIQEAVRRVAEKEPLRNIAKDFGVNASSISRAVKKYAPGGGGVPEKLTREEVPEAEVGQVVNRAELDGTVEVLSYDKLLTPEEIAAASGLDTKRWIPQYGRSRLYQSFYKLKNFLGKPLVESIGKLFRKGLSDDEVFAEINRGLVQGHQKVQLFGSGATFKRIMTESMEEALLDFIREHSAPLPPVKRKKGRRKKDADQIVSWGMWDAHLGAYAWRDEVGADWDISIAKRRVMNSVDDMLDELRPYPIRKVIMPVGNDFLHFDNARQRTTTGEHHLDTDSRFARVYTAGLECLCYMVERAAAEFGNVEVIYVPGNHDAVLSYTLCAVLAHRFLWDERVTVDLGANPRKFRLNGGVLLGFDHGARSKPAQLALTFAQQAIEYWSRSTYREIQVGDKHQKWEGMWEGAVPTNGVLIRRHPALCNVDFWHHEQSLIGEPMKSVEAWRYDEVGCRGSHVAWAQDEERPRAKKLLPEMP
jgi:transposase-like protein